MKISQIKEMTPAAWAKALEVRSMPTAPATAQVLASAPLQAAA